MRNWVLGVFLLTGICLTAQQAVEEPGAAWWRHVKVLAADSMEGRETGSPGMRRAARYVVDELKKLGASPAGTTGYYQPVRLLQRTLDEERSSLSLVHEGAEEPIKLGDEAYFSTRVDLAPQVDAALVFVGYGIKVPETGYDDLAGLDLKRKVVVLFSGAPAEIPSDLASHYQSTGERWRALRAAGAIGVISIPNPAAMDIPWSRQMASRLHPSMKLTDQAMSEVNGWQLSVAWNPEHAEKLFRSSGHTASELIELVKARRPLPRFPLDLTVRARTVVAYRRVDSFNVVARLEGSDPKLKDENVVLSAHLDHLGISMPTAGDPKGDKIYNGAMDNASGCAMLLEVAREVQKRKANHKRSLLFVFVTAEEKGLLGSRHFAKNPTIPRQSIVADINIDMFLPINPPNKIIVRGMNESDLGDWAKTAVEQAGAHAQLDPEPQRNSFIRSDQYNFIREGVPSVVMSIGYEKGSAEEHTVHDWLKERYHAPSDDLDQPVNLGAAAKYEQIVKKLMLATANADRRPRWKGTSFFRRFANKAGN